MRAALALTVTGALAACATVPVEQGRAVSQRLEASVGAGAAWPQTDAEDAARQALVAAALAEPLTPETAVQVSLANNARVIAAFEGLSVARADYLNAVFPPNPFVGFMRLSPDDGGAANVTYKAGIDLLGLLTLPATARAGAASRDAAVAEAAGALLRIAGEARAAMIAYIAARQEADLMAQAADAADAAADASDALFAAGNVAKVERDRERLFAEEIALQNAAAQAQLARARERVNAALGLSGASAQTWTSLSRLSAPSPAPIATAEIEALALSASVDVAIAVGALEAARARRGAGWLTSIVPGLSLEGEWERDDGEWKSGPGIELLAPIFDLGGRERLRLAATARRNAALARAVRVELAAEARAQAVTTEAARLAAVRRREVLLPLSADVFEGAQRDFNAMGISLVQLLDAKRRRLEDGLASVRATRDYWLAQAELDLLKAGARSEGGMVEPDAEQGPGKSEGVH